MKIFGKKAFVFALDAAFAVLLVMLVLSITSYYVGKANIDPLPKLQMTRVGYDIVRLLDSNNSLDTLDESTIENDLSNLLPENYEMYIKITGNFPQQRLTIGNFSQKKHDIGSGKWIFVVSNETDIEYFGTAQFWIWLK
jgi:hypothetical protein